MRTNSNGADVEFWCAVGRLLPRTLDGKGVSKAGRSIRSRLADGESAASILAELEEAKRLRTPGRITGRMVNGKFEPVGRTSEGEAL